MGVADFSARLDTAQREAASSGGRRTLVVAGPGSGKTSVLAARYASLVGQGVAPENILALTFTNRAADVMRKRVGSLAGLYSDDLFICTFHAFSHRLLKSEVPGIRLISNAEAMEMLASMEPGVTKKASERVLEARAGRAGSIGDKEAALLKEYESRLRGMNAVDLSGLVAQAHGFLARNPSALGRWQGAFGHVLVDEYQDIDPAQSGLVRLFIGAGASLFAIGDPDQTIYGFRGANLDGMLGFEREFPGADVKTLETNYRSLSSIVLASGAVIRNNRKRFERPLTSAKEGGALVVAECEDESAEARFIVREIESLMGGIASLTASADGLGFRFSDFAVLCRTNHKARALERSFSRSGMPCELVMPLSERRIDALMTRLRGAAPDANLSSMVMSEARASGLDEGLSQRLSGLARRYDLLPLSEGLARFMEEAILREPEEDMAIEADKVRFMTVHQAKGMEFEVVFMAGLGQGLFPLEGADIEEERRLFYVGMTRAKQRLYLSHAGAGGFSSGARDNGPSRFLAETPAGLVSAWVKEKRKVRRPVQRGLFD